MLQISEIYSAICGESRFSGYPCLLIRLVGCHVRCRWCDSAHAFTGGQAVPVTELLRQAVACGLPAVLVTGGEPLLQPEVSDLLAGLLDAERRVLLETGGTRLPAGSLPLSEVPARVHRIVDLKAPGSCLDPDLIDWPGLGVLTARDELKIVCADRRDYLWARDLLVAGTSWPAQVPVSLSPVQGELRARDLAEWILADGLDARLQLQLHRVLWPDRERGT